jgi:RNA polymerase sigma-70 factor (ECF subfamily)
MARVSATDEIAVLFSNREFEERIRAVMPDLLSYFLRRVDPVADAADCLSETLIVLWRRKADLPSEDDGGRAWAFGIARKVLSNQRRGRLRQSRLSELLKDELAAFAPPSSDLAVSVREALAMLGEKDSELLTLVVWDGFGVAQAGAIIGVKPAAARARYARARARMRALLE